MPSDDSKDYATSEVDFYALLEVQFECSQKDIDRGWRRAALKYHPDKVGANDTAAKEKFHLAQIGYDLLSDPANKALYDNARSARLQRKRQNELFDSRRRQMKDDLEARERGAKRPREDDGGEEEKLEREIRRLAEDGKRRRKEREDALRRDMEKEVETAKSNAGTPSKNGASANGAATGQSDVSELDRTVKVRWPVEGEGGGSMTSDQVKSLFSKFGKIESADLLNPRMIRLGQKQKKRLAVVCMLQYKSVVGAYSAVEDFSKQEGLDWQLFDSVSWAANKEPGFLNFGTAKDTSCDPAPSTPGSKHATKQWSGITSAAVTPSPKATPQTNGDAIKKKPSFASFSSAANTPKSSPFGKSLGANSPSLEEMTMIRLKKAEKRRLAAEIERQDAEEDAAIEAMEVSK